MGEERERESTEYIRQKYKKQVEWWLGLDVNVMVLFLPLLLLFLLSAAVCRPDRQHAGLTWSQDAPTPPAPQLPHLPLRHEERQEILQPNHSN